MISLNNTQDFEDYYEWYVVSQIPIQQDRETYYKVVFQESLSKVDGFGPKQVEVISKQSVEMHLVSLIKSCQPTQQLYKQAIKTNNAITGHDVKIILNDEGLFSAYTRLNDGLISLGFGFPLYGLLTSLVFELTNVTSIKELRQAWSLGKEAHVKKIESIEFEGTEKCMELLRQAAEKRVWHPQLCNDIETFCDKYAIEREPNAHADWEKIKDGPHVKFYQAQYDLYRAQEGFVNLDSARQSTIEACGPNDEAIVKTMTEEEDRLGKAAASPNSQNLTERGIHSQQDQLPDFEPMLSSDDEEPVYTLNLDQEKLTYKPRNGSSRRVWKV